MTLSQAINFLCFAAIPIENCNLREVNLSSPSQSMFGFSVFYNEEFHWRRGKMLSIVYQFTTEVNVHWLWKVCFKFDCWKWEEMDVGLNTNFQNFGAHSLLTLSLLLANAISYWFWFPLLLVHLLIPPFDFPCYWYFSWFWFWFPLLLIFAISSFIGVFTFSNFLN